MNRLPTAKRVQMLGMLAEGMSVRAVARVADVSINTVTKLMIEAGRACEAYHGEMARDVEAQRIQCDEIWSFRYSKQQNVETAKRQDQAYGDVWTWTALDADSKMIVSYLVGGRDSDYAMGLIDDLRQRLAHRVQLTTDGHKAYLEAVEGAFGADVDYAMLVKLFGAAHESARGRYCPAECIGARKEPIEGHTDPKHISTSYVERQNLTMSMHMRRFTRLTNGFSKKIENYAHAVALHMTLYNFSCQHKSLGGISPAMAAGVSDTLRDLDWIVSLVDAQAEELKRAKTYRKRKEISK